MCLSVPAKVIRREGSMGTVDLRGVQVEVAFDLLPDVIAGEYVLVHAGYALERFRVEEAHQQLARLDEEDRRIKPEPS